MSKIIDKKSTHAIWGHAAWVLLWTAAAAAAVEVVVVG
jgi:hypothetical protein